MSDGEFEDRDRRRLPSGTGPRLWPRGIDIRQVKIGLACRALATHDQLRRVLEKLNRSTTPESVMRLSNAPRMVRGDLKRRGRGGIAVQSASRAVVARSALIVGGVGARNQFADQYRKLIN